MKWIRLDPTGELVNLFRCRSIEHRGLHILYIFHTDAVMVEEFKSEDCALGRYKQLINLLGVVQ